MYRSHVLVCGGTGCTSSGSEQIIKALETEIKKVGLAFGVLRRKSAVHRDRKAADRYAAVGLRMFGVAREVSDQKNLVHPFPPFMRSTS